ncbi:MAG: homocysteine S-methyltransferase family protein [Thermodesulfobacteriota bacterium]
MSTSAARSIANGRTYLTPGGTETFMLFQQGFPLREGCAFEIFDDDAAWTRLRTEYLDRIFRAAQEHGHGLLLDTLVWRAHPDYVAALGYPAGDLARFNELAVERTRQAVAEWRARDGARRGELPVVLTADVGPRGDGYKVSDAGVTPEAARAYHRAQIEVLARAGVELVCALTMTSVAESIGVALAARDCGLPLIVSPTVETDGTLPDGTPLGELVRQVDEATGGAPLFYMVNCAHPTHVAGALARAKAAGEAWLGRFKGIRANSSRKSHAELDDSPELDRGNPQELGREVAAMKREYGLRVVGGCCGTDAEHIAAIARESVAA